MLKMEELGLHQPTMGPIQEDANLHQAESGGSQHNNSFVNLQQRGDHEGSVHTTHTSKSQSRGKSYVSHAKNERDMQHEIDELKKELCRARRRCSSPNSELSSEEIDDATYRRRFRTPPSETFSYDEEYHHRRRNKSPPRKGLGNNAMNKALSLVSKSPFRRNIEDASLPRRFHQPTFTLYNGRIDPVEHVSHFSQKMAVHSRDEVLICKIFPSSLGPMAMRWFNGLKANSIDSFKKFTQAFGARSITCSRVPQLLGPLLSMSMRDEETLKAYSDRYWEMFNEIDRSYDDVAIGTFKASLPAEHDLRKSLTSKPIVNVRQLMDRIDKYRRIEKNQLQGKGKAKVVPQERRDFRSDRIGSRTTDLRKILLGSLDLPTPKRLMLYFESQYNKSWRRLKTSRSSGG